MILIQRGYKDHWYLAGNGKTRSLAKDLQMKQCKRCIFWLLIYLSLGLGGFVLAQNSRFEECNSIDESSLRDELNSLNQELFGADVNALELGPIIAKQWRLVGMDEVIEQEVENSTNLIRQNTNYFGRLWSSWNTKKAQALAEEITNYTFNSEGFSAGIEKLSNAVAADITGELETVTQRVASSTILCIQEFISDSYGSTVQEAFEAELVAKTAEVDLNQVGEDVNPRPIAGNTALGISVIVAGVIARRLLQRLGTRISQRIAGRIASRVAGRAASAAIPVVGWVVGLGLIAWDLVDGNNGALPMIEKALTSEEVAKEIQAEIALSIEDELEAISVETAREIADTIYNEWQDFRFKFQRVLNLAEVNSEFKAFLGGVTSNKFQLLSESLDIAGEEELLQALDSGRLAQLVDLPISSTALLKRLKSIPEVLAWAELAGSRFDEVVKIEPLYLHKEPSDFSKETLKNLLALNNSEAIANLALMSTSTLNTLLSNLSTASLRLVALEHSPLLLSSLAWYVERLPKDAYSQLITLWTQSPQLAGKYTNSQAKHGIVGSGNPNAAILFLTTDTSLFSIYRDLPKILSGEISISLFLAKYNMQQVFLYGVLALLVVLLVINSLSRLLFGSRQKVIIREVKSKEDKA